MSLLRDWWNAVRRRLRQIDECPPVSVGLRDPFGPDDVFTAPLSDERWEDNSTTIVVRRIDPDSDKSIDLNREEIN